VSNVLGFQYVKGQNDLVAFHEYLGVSEGPDECLVTVNDEKRSSCDLVSCSNENGESKKFEGFSVNCDNVQDGTSFDGCYQLPDVAGVFQFLAKSGFKKCVPVMDPFETCRSTRDETMVVDPSLETTCTCEQLGNNSFGLFCTDAVGCQCCDKNETVCA
jgi:hypothetical protein